MFINYNRISREMWITDYNGTVRARKTAAKGEKMVNAAGQFLTENGFARKGNYMLLASGSPLRYATLVPKVAHGHRESGDVLASAVSRVLNYRYPHRQFSVHQRGTAAVITGQCDGEVFTYLVNKGYSVKPQSRSELLVDGRLGR